MAINRRVFSFGLGASAFGLPLTASALPSRDVTEDTLFAATRKSKDGRYSAAIFRRDGRDVVSVPLRARGHDIAVCPVTRTIVAFARRPGNFAVAFRADLSWRPTRFSAPPERHFYGHGVFSTDGRLLFATENDFEAGRGVIGVYDATGGFSRVGELDTHGVGPHDLALLPDGRTLVVANGGIETHPEIGGGRAKLNLPTMSPSLVFIDALTGDLVERQLLPSSMRKISLRHLSVGDGNRMIVGGQLQKGGEPAPLIFSQRMGDVLTPLPTPHDLTLQLRGYISSVSVNKTGDIAALTSSRGGIVLYLDVATGQVKGTQRIRDVSGVAANGTGFLFTNGHGQIFRGTQKTDTRWQWDNHAAAL